MATYGDLKARIASEMKRDDLLDATEQLPDLERKINEAIRFYQARNWWFLTTTTTAPTVANQNYISRPTNMQMIRRVSIPSLGVDLDKIDLTEIERNDEPTVFTGQPCCWAEGEAGAQLRLWPTPNAVFTVKIVGTRLTAALSGDSDQNVWTNEGYDLITAKARELLYRDVLRDPEGAQMAIGAIQEAESALNMTNIDRFDGPVCAGW